MNRAAARLARDAADEAEAGRPAGRGTWPGRSGPTTRTASISPDVNDPAARAVTFDDLVVAYREAVEGLVEGGVDLLLVETIFDTLNAKAAIFALESFFEEPGCRLPVMISGTITDASGRTLSGQTVEAFWDSRRATPARDRRAQLRPRRAPAAALRPGARRLAGVPLSAYPNAGLPNEFGDYDERRGGDGRRSSVTSPGSGYVNLVGGCCGTTPEHVRGDRRDGRGGSRRGEIPRIAPRDAAGRARAARRSVPARSSSTSASGRT